MERTGELVSEKSLDPKQLYNFAPSKVEPFSNSMDPHDPYHYSDTFLSGEEQMARSSKMRRESLLMDPQMQGFKLSRVSQVERACVFVFQLKVVCSYLLFFFNLFSYSG